MTVLQRPMADLGAVEFEGVQAEGFGSGEAIRTRGRAGQSLLKEFDDRWRPSCGMVATGSAGGPARWLLAGARGVVSGGQSVEAAAGEAELAGGLGRVEGVAPEMFQHMADKRGRVTMDELLMLFKGGQATR